MSLQDGAPWRVWKPGPRLRAGRGRVLDLVYPPQALDGSSAPQSSGLSADAWARVQFIAEPHCDGCGIPFEYDIDSRCAACLYDDASRALILKFKHADRTDLAKLASWIGRAAADLLAETDAVAPVPLLPSRLLSRRYNQAAEIARPLARAYRLAYLPGCPHAGAAHRKPGRQVRFRAPPQRRRRLRGPAGGTFQDRGKAHPADRRCAHKRLGRGGLRAGAVEGRRGAHRCRGSRPRARSGKPDYITALTFR
jgi:predicted amidophosphoribosyltransferase